MQLISCNNSDNSGTVLFQLFNTDCTLHQHSLHSILTGPRTGVGTADVVTTHTGHSADIITSMPTTDTNSNRLLFTEIPFDSQCNWQ